jgi:hypothetical protein
MDDRGAGSGNCTIKKCETESEVDDQAMTRALGLLATWALRRAQVSPGGRWECARNRVTAGDIKGYGGRGVDN